MRTSTTPGTLTVSIRDVCGNLSKIERTFSIGPATVTTTLTPHPMATGGGFRMTLTGDQGRKHRIDFSEDMTDWAPFLTLLDYDGAQDALDTGAGAYPQGYYRAIPLAP